MERMLAPNLMNSADEVAKELDGIPTTGKRLSKWDINFSEVYTSLIDEGDYDPNNENDVSLLLLLTMMCEIFIFHSLLILQKEDEKCEDLYRNEFFLLIKKDNLLPVDFCTDLLIKHKLQSDACKFLFIKNDYDRLMEYIQDFYETSGDGKWLQKYAKYIKKVRELNANNKRFPYDFVLKHVSFLFDKKWEDIAMSCLMHYKDIPPLYSKKIIEIVKNKGSPELCRKYLEYLTMTYNVSEPKYHTELAVSYINEIIAIVDSKYRYEGEIDLEGVENDVAIWRLRSKLMEFLESSRKYNLNTIFIKLPYEYMLPEIAFILAWDKQYTKAFEICIKELNNIEFSQSICKKVYKLNGDDSIFFKLFEVYYDHNLSDCAIDLLENKVDHIPYSKVFKVFKSGEILTDKHYKVFSDIFKRVEKIKNQTFIYERLSNYDLLSHKVEIWDAQADYFRLSKEMNWGYCEKGFKAPNVYYDYKHKKAYHVYCKPFVSELNERT